MTYLEFLGQWYNWPYLAALLFAGIARVVPGRLTQLTGPLARAIGLQESSAKTAASVFGVVLAVVGLTLNGALHDYWPSALPIGFFPGLAVAVVAAAWVARRVGRVVERHFPEIRAVGLGASDLAGSQGTVVSREISPDYRAGRAQVMQEDGTLHMVMCKTREGTIPYGALVWLREYDPEDGRYFVESAEEVPSVAEDRETPGQE